MPVVPRGDDPALDFFSASQTPFLPRVRLWNIVRGNLYHTDLFIPVSVRGDAYMYTYALIIPCVCVWVSVCVSVSVCATTRLMSSKHKAVYSHVYNSPPSSTAWQCAARSWPPISPASWAKTEDGFPAQILKNQLHSTYLQQMEPNGWGLKISSK